MFRSLCDYGEHFWGPQMFRVIKNIFMHCITKK